MKNKLQIFAILAITLLGGCKKGEEPSKIIRTQVGPTLYPRIIELFPEGQSNITSYPALFSDTVQKELLLVKESEVYVTFISEAALYFNTLGWYSYTNGHRPNSVTEISKEVLFENISSPPLEQGDMLQVGAQKFPAGTVIGFFLISNGYSEKGINFNNPTFYTDLNLNSNNSQHHVLFREKNLGNIILGFEDLPFDSTACDKDYNDVLFSITDNKDGFKDISFDDSKIPKL